MEIPQARIVSVEAATPTPRCNGSGHAWQRRLQLRSSGGTPCGAEFCHSDSGSADHACKAPSTSRDTERTFYSFDSDGLLTSVDSASIAAARQEQVALPRARAEVEEESAAARALEWFQTTFSQIAQNGCVTLHDFKQAVKEREV